MINIILLILISLLVYVFFYLKKEHFSDNIQKILTNGTNEDKKRYTDTFDDIKSSSDGFNFDLNKIDITSPYIDTYLNNIIINKKLQQKTHNNELPLMTDNNKSNYIHKLKLLINSRKIAQNVVLNVLKNKINYIMGTTKNVKYIKKNITD
jgi:hypothetical protein